MLINGVCYAVITWINWIEDEWFYALTFFRITLIKAFFDIWIQTPYPA